MKKILFTLCALVTMGTMFGTTTVFNLKTIPNLAAEYGWQNTSKPFHAYQTFALDENITVVANSKTSCETAEANINGIFSNNKWYVYKVDNEGSFSIKAKDGYIIKTIAITYGVGDNGILISEPGSTTQIASNTAIEINAQTATLYVGNSTGAADKGRLTITQFVVTYSLISSSDETYTEKFDSCGIADAIVTKKFNGNNGVYKWSVKNIRRLNGTGSDELASGQGMRVRYEGYIQSDGNLEGGIKSVAFDWHPTSGTLISDFYVKVGGAEPYHHNSTGVIGTFPFSYDFNVAKNTTLSIENAVKIGTDGQAFQVIGPVTITPYLLFTKKNLEYQYTATQSLDLSTIIINNTGATPTYTISDGASATIENGVVKFANKEESFTVTATWGEVSTTTTIAVHALPVPEFSIDGVAEGKMTKTMYDGAFTPTPIVKVNGVPVESPVVTYTSSDENIVKAENGGLTILAAGSVTITANLAASAAYQAAETTFTLDVTGIEEGDANKVIEGYSKLTQSGGWSSATEPVEFEGDNTPYSWKAFYYQYYPTNAKLQINDAAGVMLATGSGYLSATIEGGVKAIAFDWKIYEGKNSISAELYAGETLLKTMSYTGLTAWTTNHYECALEQKSNVEIKLLNKSQNDVYGPITIVPYLLYTEKSAEMWAKNGAYTHALINNTGEAPTFTLEDNDGEATIDAATGAVTALKEGEVTVKASWNDGKVYTTYTLKMHLEAPNASFADPEVEKSIGDAAFTNALTKSESAGTVSYSSSDETVATVNETTGEVTIVNGGTVRISASIAASATCRDTLLYYTLDVKDTPTEGTYWEETFSKCPMENTQETKQVIGDSAVYNWSLTNFQRSSTNDIVDGKQGMRLRYPSVWTMTDPEGGIKEVVFDWIASGKDMPVHFFIAAGTNEYEYTRDKVGVNNKIMHFARQFNEPSNVALTLHMSGAQETPQQTYAVVGPIKIVPYLLFTKKNPGYQYTATQSLDLSTIIINNTGATPTYTISDGASATIEGSVVTFANKEESFTVTATWENVSTTTTIAVHALPVPTFTIEDVAEGKMTKTMYDGTFTPTPIVKVGDVEQTSAVVTYTSSDENIVKAENGGLTILAAGSVTITANLAASETYQAAQTTFTLDVTGIEEDAEDMIQEKYEGLTLQKNWYSEVVTYTGTQGYEWSVKYYQFGGHKAGEADAVRLAQYGFDNYISAEIEGGVKALAFDWMLKGVSAQFASQISMDDKSYTVSYASGVSLETPYHCEIPLEVKKNATLKIVNAPASIGSAANYGPITIVPYLLYTEKEVSINPLENATYTNTAIINNIPDGGTVTYSIENQGQTEVDAIAVINAETGEVTMKSAGTVKVIATWGDVTTSYLLTIELPTPVISGLVATTIDLDGGSYTPSLTATIGEQTIENAVFELKSSDLTKAIVQDGTTFVPVANGSAKMTATLKAGTFNGIAYKSVSLSNIVLTINAYTLEENFVETFRNLETGESTETTEFNGDNNVYTWSAHNYTKSDDAIVINTTDGSLSSNGVQEGGIKYMTFKWLASEKATEPMGFVITMNGESATYHFESAQRTTESYTWERMFNAKQNSQFSITLENGSSKGVKIMNAEITIVPYLLYTEKEAIIEVGQTFTNEALINNLGEEETITYSIVSGSEYATIEDDVITAIAEGNVVVKASWNDDQITTTYTVHINPMSALVISEDDEDLATLVEEKEGQTLDVTLQRAMVADGAYSTIFLPFAMNATQIAAVFGEGTQVAQLLSSELVGDLLTFNFDFVTEMSACVPYLINPTQDVTEVNIANVTIVKPEDPVTVADGKFHGILAKQSAMDITNLYFLGNDNILVTYPGITEQEVSGLRAYFTLNNPTSGVHARCVIGRSQPTVLPLVNGQLVNGVKKMIIDNQLIIIRNTDMYNAQGNKLQ